MLESFRKVTAWIVVSIRCVTVTNVKQGIIPVCYGLKHGFTLTNTVSFVKQGVIPQGFVTGLNMDSL